MVEKKKEKKTRKQESGNKEKEKRNSLQRHSTNKNMGAISQRGYYLRETPEKITDNIDIPNGTCSHTFVLQSAHHHSVGPIFLLRRKRRKESPGSITPFPVPPDNDSCPALPVAPTPLCPWTDRPAGATSLLSGPPPSLSPPFFVKKVRENASRKEVPNLLRRPFYRTIC